jgi:hypothetical protein
MNSTNTVYQWLMDGDPAIRWQTLRDLQDVPRKRWEAEQRRTLNEGWGKQLLDLQSKDGSWGGGIYSPKWISTTYTLLMLRAIGIPRDYLPAQKAAALIIDKQLGTTCDNSFLRNIASCDRCIIGFDLTLAAYFKLRGKRVDALVQNLLSEMMPDGAWNCRRNSRPRPHHSSFHTTLNVLEGLRDWLEATLKHSLRNDVLKAEKKALEFMLAHRLFKSHRTGSIINPKFTLLSYPHRWHYDVLRGLVYFARVNATHDVRLQDAIDLLCAQRRADGTWPLQYKYSGKVFFDMEKVGQQSRWNTLRALRVLKWWEARY